MDAIYHMLAKVLKFSTTKMHCAKDNQEDFQGLYVGLKVREKKWTNILGMWSYKS